MTQLRRMDPGTLCMAQTRGTIAEVVAKLGASAAHGDRWLTGYAKNKMRLDPLYREALPLIPAGVTVLDLGCGVGLLGMLLAARAQENRTHGIEWDVIKARFAHRMLERTAGARVVCGDVLTEPWPDCAVVAAFDILHYLPVEVQRTLLFKIGAHLPEGGRLLLRVMDSLAGGMAAVTRLCEQMAVGCGWNRAARVHWRPLRDTKRDLLAAGLVPLAARQSTGSSTGNHLLAYVKQEPSQAWGSIDLKGRALRLDGVVPSVAGVAGP